MKRRKIIYLLLTILCVAGISLYFLYYVVTEDWREPVIYVPSDVLELSISDGRAKILEDVTAYDNRNGDVTGSIVLEKIKALKNDGSAKAVLAAFDRNGNVTKAERCIRYTDYRSPKISVTAPLLFKEETVYNLLDCVTAEDVIDGDISDRVKVTILEAEHAASQPGEFKVRFRVTNSLGDTVYLDAPVLVYSADSYNGSVELTQYMVRLKKGARFDPEGYFKAFRGGARIYDMTDEELQLEIDQAVNTGEPGVYAVTYTAVRGDYTGCSRLLAVVEE